MLLDRIGKQNHFVSAFVTSNAINLSSPVLQHIYRSEPNVFYFILHIAVYNVFSRTNYKTVSFLTGKFNHILFTQYLHQLTIRLIGATPVPIRIKEWAA